MNIILQHWNGPMPAWADAASTTVQIYCDKIGAEYKCIRGMPLGEEHGPFTQKLYHLDPEFDEYDNVLMLDMDTIATRQYNNVFDRPEIGVLHDRAMIGPERSRTPNGAPNLYKQGAHVFFGNFIKLRRDQRLKLRKHIDWKLFRREVVDHYAGDEIILHYLIHKSNLLEGLSYEDVCMRTSGTSYKDIHFREHNRYDRKFCNQPEDSDSDASLIHFCRSRKKQIVPTVKRLFGSLP